MNHSDQKRAQPHGEVAQPAGSHAQPPRRSLRSLRIVPVSSVHFFGRRFVMELTTAGQARELRVFRSIEQLMEGVAALGISRNMQESLCRRLLQEGACEMLDIVL